MPTDLLDTTAQLFKALGDPTRLRMLNLLQHGELCVCDIMAVLDLPQSTASRHLGYLRNAGWLSARRQNKWIYYRLAGDTVDPAVKRALLALLDRQGLEGDSRALAHHLKEKQQDACTK